MFALTASSAFCSMSAVAMFSNGRPVFFFDGSEEVVFGNEAEFQDTFGE